MRMNHRNVLLFGVISALALFFSFKCTKKGSEPSPSEPPVYEETGTVGSTGGRVQISDDSSSIKGAYVSIPKGALDQEITISISIPTDTIFFEEDTLHTPVSIEPFGTVFDTPVEIGLPWPEDSSNVDSLEAFYFDEDKSLWKKLPTLRMDNENRLLIAQTIHFTVFTVKNTNVRFDVEMFQNCGRIAASVQLLNKLTEVPTDWRTLVRDGASNIGQLLDRKPFEVIAHYEVILKEKKTFWFDPDLETDIVEWGVRTDYGVLYDVQAKDKNGKRLYDTPLYPRQYPPLDVNGVSEFFSAKPVLFNFDHQPQNDKEYYVEVDLYFVNTWGWVYYSGGFWGTQGYFVSSSDITSFPKRLSEMPEAPDKDCDRIIDYYDVNQPPQVIISSPSDGTSFIQGQRINFAGSAEDPEDGTLTGSSLIWTSNRDGTIGTGTSFASNNLSLNHHTITLTATDLDGLNGTATAQIDVLPPPDNIAPSTISDLAAGDASQSSIKLTWTAPGDDGNSGTASQYDIRHSTSTITSSNWNSATQCSGEPSPKSAGSSESFTVTGLNTNTTYYFAIKTADEVPNWSGLSNVVSKKTLSASDNMAPAAITDLAAGDPTQTSIRLTWTAPGDDGNTGTASQYDVRYCTSTVTSSNWNSATQCSGEPTPKSAGSSESFTVTGLNSNTTYYFAIKTADEVPNWSDLSNVVSKKTLSATDVTPPAAVTDLATGDPTQSTIRLTWTSPGDDGNTGTASQYDVRYCTSTITSSNWNSATQCSGEPTPKSAGSSESFTVTALSSNTTYYFALKTADEVPNWSGLSNVPSEKTSSTVGKWTTYNTSNSGLARDFIYAIAIDASDDKWFGHDAGVCKFDDTNWKTYNTSNSGLASSFVLAIAIDASGCIWFGTSCGGVSKLDGANWTTYESRNSGLAYDCVHAVALDSSGSMWFGTWGLYAEPKRGGVSKFDGTNWITYDSSNSSLAEEYVHAIAIDASGSMWFGTWAGGVSKFDGANWTTYNTSNSGLAGNDVREIVVDAGDNKWFATMSGVSKFDGVNWTTYNYSNSRLAGNNVMAMTIDAFGNKWFGTLNRGVSKFDGTNWTTYDTSNSGLASNRIYRIAIDSSGNKWFGTVDSGVSKFHE